MPTAVHICVLVEEYSRLCSVTLKVECFVIDTATNGDMHFLQVGELAL